ncbi:SusC/RagA family TonB-linked outer membrane protein [Larkinella sp.]|uniref:SusC/RagA family TonB-linked outer membrane protein n=1 Tax=Larkinella sp. TaxID=2034517 RepID=UPI003BAC3C15
MRSFYLATIAALFLAFTAMAQERSVTGKVIDQSDGSPIPGVNILLKGTTTGAVTSQDGTYKISVPSAGGTLIFSFIGKKNEEQAIGQRSVIDVRLVDDARQLSEIVVTALGEKRERKALGYSVQEVKGDNLTFTKSVDVNSSLAGKVAGVQLSGSPSSSFDNANIVIRGINTLAPQVSGANTTPGATGPGISSYGSTGNNPLYIVDGTPTDQQNIIMDNVESISVLKGASATALYGNRAANGVVLITTKRGTRKTAPKIEFNLGASFENLYITPTYQDAYAGGYASNQTSKGTTLDDEGFMVFKYNPAVHPASWASFNGQRFLDYGADESWGPKINGQEYRAYWSWYQGSDFGKTTTLTAQPNNVRDFFKTGVNLNNTVSVSGGGEKSEYRITYANQHRTLTFPNAYRDQHQVGITGSYDVSKRLTVSTDLTLTSNYTKGKPIEGYNSISPTMVFNQWFQRQLDIDRLKNYRAENGAIISWNIGNPNGTGDLSVIQRPQYMNSPYFSAYEEYGTEKRTRLSGNIGLNYLINDVFTITAAARTSLNPGSGDFRIGTGGKRLDSYSLYFLNDNESNFEANLNFKKSFNDLSLTGFVGGNLRQNRYDFLFNGTTGGLSSPNYFDIAASITRPTTARVINQKDVQSVYGKASLGYKNFLFVDGTLRNDWSSALPVNNNSYLYPSISGSFVFSELLDGGVKNVLPYAKLRASYAQVGSDLGFNQVNTALVNGSLYNGNPSVEIGNQYRTGQVQPALSKSWEVGAEVRLFNKLNVDFAYYVDNNINQILSLDVSPTSGYSSAQVNAGNIQRKGWELSLSGTPVKRGNFSWDLTLNLARNVSFVKDLTADLNTYTYATSGDIRVEANKGQKWGNIYGRIWTTNAAGLPVFSAANGTVSYTTGNYLGNIQPDLTGGLYNTLSYGPFNLSFSLDFQKGGLFYSTTKMFNVGTGLSEYTVGVNDKGNDIRDFPAAGGGVRMDGVLNDAPLTVYVPARLYYYTNYQRDSRNLILDASYVKLREVRFGYSLPAKLLSRIGISQANFGILVNNALLIAAPARKWGLDPSEIENYWYEGGQLSSSRTTGFNLRLTL